MKRLSFDKKKRLASNKQFKAVLAHHVSISNGLLRLYMAENHLDYSRLGISVGKSCGGAVVRNRLKRLLRETFRQSQQQIPVGFDYLLMISPQCSKRMSGSARREKTWSRPTFEQVKTSFLTLIDELQKKQRGRRTKSGR